MCNCMCIYMYIPSSKDPVAYYGVYEEKPHHQSHETETHSEQLSKCVYDLLYGRPVPAMRCVIAINNYV